MVIKTEGDAWVRLCNVLALDLVSCVCEARETVSLLLACLPTEALQRAVYAIIEGIQPRWLVDEFLMLIAGERMLRAALVAE